ncbi:MAG: type II secretion system protein [Phycisphaerae bacterium]|nr:type II secretion system protein [Phycisphaerae bacterium]
MRFARTNAFTLIETVAALAIVSIALLGLLQLHLVSIRVADKSQMTTQAVFLAQAKMAEVLASGYPSLGTHSGVEESDGVQFGWRTEVTDAPASQRQLLGVRLDRLRRVSVEVTCGDGPRERQIQLTTCVAENKIRETQDRT